MPHYYPRHLETFDYIGMHRYFLTFCTDGRAKRFEDREQVDVAQSQILRAAGEQGFEITVYCYMPDHAHLLVRGTYEAAEALTFISRAKQYSAFHYKRRFLRRLWQRYSYEHVLREDIEEAATIRYIIDNPVRAGMVKRPAEYPFTGSMRYTIEELEQLASPCDESKIPRWLADEPWEVTRSSGDRLRQRCGAREAGTD
jgi:REP element-mobilizing transposase RayT